MSVPTGYEMRLLSTRLNRTTLGMASGSCRNTWDTPVLIPQPGTERYRERNTGNGIKSYGRGRPVVEALRPKRGGFLRPFGHASFVLEFLLGHGPHGSPTVDPRIGAPQADVFYHYKMALRKTTAIDNATRSEERQALQEKRPIDPGNIENLTERYVARMPYKAQGCRFHSFVVYFSNLQRLGWVEFSGKEEPSAFQDHYPPGPTPPLLQADRCRDASRRYGMVEPPSRSVPE